MTDAVPLVRGPEHRRRHLGCDRFHQEPGNKRVFWYWVSFPNSSELFNHELRMVLALSAHIL